MLKSFALTLAQVAVIIVAVPVSIFAEAENKVANGDMESGSPPERWMAGGAVLSAEKTQKHGGAQSLKITRAGPGAYGMAAQLLHLKPGTEYKLSVAVFIPSASSSAHAEIAVATSKVGREFLYLKAGKLDRWEEKEFVFTPQFPLCYLRLSAQEREGGNGRNYFYADSISVTATGKPAERHEPERKTASPSDPTTPQILLHVPFDGSADAKISGGNPKGFNGGELVYEPGKKGQAVRVKSGSLLYDTEDNMKHDRGTIMMWVKLDEDPKHQRWDMLFDSVFPGQNGQCMLMHFHTTAKAWRFGIGSTRLECYGRKLAGREANRWYHLAVTWDVEIGAAIYIDGVRSGGRGGAAVVGARARVPRIEWLYIGVSAIGSGRSNHLTDELTIYDRALEPSQIEVIYKRQSYKEERRPVVAEKAKKEDSKNVVIQNRFLKMVFDPSKGGVCTSLTDRESGKQYTILNDEPGWPGALFMDRLWHPENLFGGLSYSYKLSNTDDKSSVHLWRRGDKGVIFYLEIHKTITLFHDRNLVRVDYELKNLPESFKDMSCGIQFHNFLGVKGEDNTYFTPTTEGVKSVNYLYSSGVLPKKANHWYTNPSRGWNAVIGSSGHGMAFEMEYKYLDCFYNWLGLPVGTQEWMTRKQLIKSGGSFRTTYYLYPFKDFSRVDGVFDGLVCALEGDDKFDTGNAISGTGVVRSTVKKSMELRLRYRTLPSKEWNDVQQWPLNLEAGATVKKTFSFIPKAPGTVVLNCLVIDGDREVGSFERPIIVGKATGNYVVEPESKRVGVSRYAKAGDAGSEREPGRPLSTKVPTPHVKWAKPYSKGETKALFLTDVMHQREIVELWQRLSLRINTVKYSWDKSHENFNYYGDPTINNRKDQKKATLRFLSKEPEVIVIGGLDWSFHFDEKVREKILELVKNGTGLIYVAPMGLEGDLAKALPLATDANLNRINGSWMKTRKHYLTDGISFDVFPRCRNITYRAQGDVLATVAKRNEPILAVGHYGTGRLAAFGYDVYVHNKNSGLLPTRLVGEMPGVRAPIFDDGNLTWDYWEYYYALLAKTIVWAAGKESSVIIDRLEAVEGSSVELSLRAAEELNVNVILKIKDKYSKLQQSNEREVKLSAQQTVTTKFKLQDNLIEGSHFIDLVVKDRKGDVLNWGAARFVIEKPVKIARVHLTQEAFPQGQSITGKMTLSAAAGSHLLRARLYDFYGRLLDERKLRPKTTEAKEIAFSIPSKRILTNTARIDCELLNEGELSDIRRETFIVHQPRKFKKFVYGVWWHEFPRKHLLPYFFSQLRKCGIENIRFGNLGQARFVVTIGNMETHDPYGLVYYRYDRQDNKKRIAQYTKSKNKSALVRNPCVNDPQWTVDRKGWIHKVWRKKHAVSPNYYIYSGDEWHIGDRYCFSVHCMNKMRGWLKERYGDLRNLNAEWGSNFPDWMKVLPDTIEEAEQKGNFASWGDHRLFMEENFTEYIAFWTKAAREMDPQAVTMIGAINASYDWGHDWYALMKAGIKPMPYMSFDTFSTIEVARSFALKGQRIGAYEEPWWALMHHCDNMSHWTAHRFVQPDFEIDKSLHSFTEEAVRSGIYDLLRNAERDHSGIAVHYSTSSRYASHISGYTEFLKNLGSWQHLFEDLGLQYNFVARQQIEEGGLTAKKYKVLIMPGSLSVSDKEGKGIRNFVSQGGLIVGDIRTGLFTRNCKARAKGCLDDVFGILRTANNSYKGGTGITFGAHTIPTSLNELNLSLSGGQSLAASKGSNGPAFISHTYGKGKACYLNFDLSGYIDFRGRSDTAERAWLRVGREILAAASVAPPAKVVNRDGTLPHCEVVMYRDGESEYMGIMRDRTIGKEAFSRIELPRKAHLYDLRAKKYLGYTNAIDGLFGKKVQLYAALPYEVKGVKLKLENTDFSRGQEVTYTSRIVGGGNNIQTHCIHVTVMGPDGREFKHRLFYRNLLTKDAKAKGSFHLALNEITGKWTLKATDVISGKSATVSFTVK